MWEDEGFVEPEIEERFDPDRTILSLTFKKKQAIKTSDKKQTQRTRENIEKIREYLRGKSEVRTNDIAEYIGLSPARTRVILKEMKDVESVGHNRNRTYKLSQNK